MRVLSRVGFLVLAIVLLAACAGDSEESNLPQYHVETEALYLELAALAPSEGITYNAAISDIRFEDDLTKASEPDRWTYWQVTGNITYDDTVTGQPGRTLAAIKDALTSKQWNAHPSLRCTLEPCSVSFSRDADDWYVQVAVVQGRANHVDSVSIYIRSPWTVVGQTDYIGVSTLLEPDPQPAPSAGPSGDD
jgi:hypothetical protein